MVIHDSKKLRLRKFSKLLTVFYVESRQFVNEHYITCQDINECNTFQNKCDDVCVNTEGSYYCECSNRLQRLSSNGYRMLESYGFMQGKIDQ